MTRAGIPNRLTVSLNLEQSTVVDQLLDQLKSRYRLEIIEYDKTGRHLDDTVFYVRYAQEVRDLIGESEETFLLSFLADTNHIAQELMDRGCDPRKAFDCVLTTGRTLNATKGDRFYADVQQFPLSPDTTLFCFQLPCGGSIFLIRTPDEIVMIDTGYGIYHEAVMTMFSHYGLGNLRNLSRIIVTHADGDHCGAAGFFPVPVFLHKDTREIIRTNNRAYGSRNQESVLEEFYTKMINLFSGFNAPQDIRCFPDPCGNIPGNLCRLSARSQVGDVTLEVLEGLGGHTCGQVFLYSPTHGLLFAADSADQFFQPLKGAGGLQFACRIPCYFGQCEQ